MKTFVKRMLTASLCLFGASTSFAQADYWAIFPGSRITTATGAIGSLTNQSYAGSNKQYPVSVFDNSGNLRFSVFDYGVYTPGGTLAFTIISGSEIEVFSNPYGCSNIYKMLYWNNSGSLVLQDVDVSSGSPVAGSSVTLKTSITGLGYTYGTLVSGINPDGTRNLYAMDATGVLTKWVVDIYGNLGTGVNLGTFPTLNATALMELATDNSAIYYISGSTGTVEKIDLTASPVTGTALSLSNVRGLEYVSSYTTGAEARLYVSYFNGATSHGGISYMRMDNGAVVSVTSVANMDQFGYTDLELARNGQLYMAANPNYSSGTVSAQGLLYTLNPVTNAITQVYNSPTSYYVNSYSNRSYFITNQIDNESYRIPNSGKGSTPTSADFQINGQAPVDPYACTPQLITCPNLMSLVFSAQGGLNYGQLYTVSWVESDSCGNVIPNPNPNLNYTDPQHSGTASVIYFANYGNKSLVNDTAQGKCFVVTVTVTDPCTHMLYVKSTLVKIGIWGSKLASWTISSQPLGGGAAVPADKCSQATTISSCKKNPQLKLSYGANASFGTAWLVIKDYTGGCTDTPNIVTIADGSLSPDVIPAPPASYVYTLADYIDNFSTNPALYDISYMKNHPGHIFEVSLHLTSNCGESVKTGYFINNSSALCRTMNPDAVQAAEDNFIIYPNPANDVVTLFANGAEGAKFSAALYDVQGRKIMDAVSETALNGWGNEFKVNVRDLPAGLYVCQYTLDGKVQSTKLTVTH